MTQRIKYSVVIPVYNGEFYLEEVSHRIKNTFEKITDDYELIFVDDGSKDQSWKKLQEIQKKDEKIKIIKLSRNYGQHNATLCGLRNGNGKYLLTLDQDLQHPPEEIPKLIKKIEEGYSLVYGRYRKKKHHWFRNFGSKITNKTLSKIAGRDFVITSFRIIKKAAIDSLEDFENPEVIIDILLSQVISDRDIGVVLVNHKQNKRDSNYSSFKLINISLNMIFNYTTAPLKIASILGLIFSLLGFGTALFYVIKYSLGYTTISGFTSVIAAVSFFSGLILLVLGVIGEYLGRIFVAVNKKPQYKIEKRLIK
jgi:polyisoprenyl-phosphate glycosyltransferase